MTGRKLDHEILPLQGAGALGVYARGKAFTSVPCAVVRRRDASSQRGAVVAGQPMISRHARSAFAVHKDQGTT
jgi:hypothetical protein